MVAMTRDVPFEVSAKPTVVQERALELVGVDATVTEAVARSM